MKTTILFKKADLLVQAIFSVFILKTLIINLELNILIAYLGTWQLFSVTVHAIFHEHLYSSVHRSSYLIFLLGLITSFLLGMLMASIIVFYMVFVAAIALMIYYMYTCFDELNILNRKAVVHLKK